MQAEYTTHQERIIRIATERFSELSPNGTTMPYFVRDKRSVRVGVVYVDGEHTYVARELIRWYATRETIQAKCDRIYRILAATYAKTNDRVDFYPPGDERKSA